MENIDKHQVLHKLDSLRISYEVTEHTAVYTIEEMDKAGLPYSEAVCKNLFLRDAKGKRHFLVVLSKEKRADLVALQTQLGCTKLGFASEERLFTFLQLEKGAVTPLGILNDSLHAVEVVFDRDVVGRPRLGVHPCVNTATVWISFDDLLRVIEENGNTVHTVDL